jgi:hypothetical protein
MKTTETKEPTFIEFMRNSPLAIVLAAGEIEVTRTRDLPRVIAL